MTLSHLFHWRSHRRVALLAAGVLDDRDRERIRAHIEACARCRRQHAELVAVVAAMESDPARSAEPELPVSVLIDRVERRLDGSGVRPSAPAVGWRLALPAAAAAVLALVLLGPEVTSRFRPEPATPAPTQAAGTPAPAGAVSAEILDRLDRNLAREHTARYLSDAQDVLLSVAATEADCVEEEDRVDVGEAPGRSRDLLARRALLVDGRPEAVASARAVLDDVEMALREVADLPSCVRRGDVQRLRQEVERRHLHMRIRLMTRELEG
jgi:hypothetical protein